MSSERNAGRLVGALVLAQLVGGVLVNFVLTAPLFGSPGFLVGASAHANQIALSALCGIALGVLSVVIAVAVLAVITERFRSLAHFLLALSTASLAATMVEQMNVISMLSLSEAYAKLPAVDRAGFEGLRLVVAGARNSAHYINLVVAGLALLVFYATMLRATLVPRALAAFGVVAASLQMIAVAMPLFGVPIVFLMLAPLGVSQLMLGLWLVTKGFPDFARPPGRADA
jgi:hypothetical protein